MLFLFSCRHCINSLGCPFYHKLSLFINEYFIIMPQLCLHETNISKHVFGNIMQEFTLNNLVKLFIRQSECFPTSKQVFYKFVSLLGIMAY